MPHCRILIIFFFFSLALANEEFADEKQKESPTHSIPGVGLSIVFIFGGLLYGGILKLFSRIPYNPLLLLSGLALGIYHEKLGIVGEATELISVMSPNGILAIFLPCLVFESAFKTEWHVFKKLAGQSLIIGILSSITGAALIMVGVKVLVDSRNLYTWQEAFLFGSLLTCTDIFSFVMKLKRTGTPQRITSLIEGESLFNYCTCVLIYQLYQYSEGLKGTGSAASYISLLFEEVFGGILFGLAFGIISVYCIKRMIYDGILVVTIMVIFCYSIYMIAEYSFLRVSGITSLVVYALYMNAFGKTWLFGETHEYVQSFWGYIVFVAQTSIFLIAGVLVGANVLQFEINTGNHEIYTVAIQIYLLALCARFLSIGVFMRYLRRLADGLTWKEVVVITFGGLKGAIGISLAMLVFKNDNYDTRVSSMILLHVTSNSLLTLIINGLSTGLLVRVLGVSTLKKVQYKFFQEYLTALEIEVLDKKNELRRERDAYDMVDWNQVDAQVGLDSYRTMKQSVEDIISKTSFTQDKKYEKRELYKLEQSLKEYRTEGQEESPMGESNVRFEVEVQYRKRFLKNLMAKYWQFHNKNYTTPAALMLLIQSANFDLDKETEELESWSWVKSEISFNIRIFSEYMKLTILNNLAKTHLFEYVSFCYDVVSSYIEANEEVRKEMLLQHIKAEEKGILVTVLQESEGNQKEAELFLAHYLEPSFPEIEREVKTRKVSFYLLHNFKRIIDKNNENGQLEANEYDLLNSIIDKKSMELNLYSPKWIPNKFLETLKADGLFGRLPLPVLVLIATELVEKFTVDANQVITESGGLAKHVYFVNKGSVMVEFTSGSQVSKKVMKRGEMFGYESMVVSDYHSRVTACTVAEIIQIKKVCIIKVLQVFPQIEEAFWKKHIYYCYKMFVNSKGISSQIGSFSEETLKDLISEFRLQKYEPRDYEVSSDMIFLRGSIEIVGEEVSIYPFLFIGEDNEKTVRVKETSYLLLGRLDLELFVRESQRSSTLYPKRRAP